MAIPIEIARIAAEALSEHNDGFAKQACRDQLLEIRDYIDRILGEQKDEVKA